MSETTPSALKLNEDSPCTFRAVADKKVRFIWEVTAKCNLACWYCFRTDPSGTANDFKFIASIAQQFDPHLTDSVMLTGGEPFLLPNFSELISLLISRSLRVKVATNLTFGTKVLQAIPDIKKIDISTSIDGSDAATHDSIRGKGSIQKIKENVAYLKDQGRAVSARCVLTEQNIRDAERLLTLAISTGFSSLTFSRLTKVPDLFALNIDQGYDAAVPKEESMAWFAELIPTLRVKYPDFAIRTAGFGVSVTPCKAAGSSLAYITAHGILHPCTLYRVDDSGLNLRNHSLASALATLGSINRSRGQSTCPSLPVLKPSRSDRLISIERSQKATIRRAVGAIVECQGDFLLVHKVKAMGTIGGPTDIEGEWGFPGGGINSEEDVETALRRELAEEVGLFTYKAVKELPPFEFEFSDHYRTRSGFARQRTRMFLVKCETPGSIVPDNNEIDEAEFYPKGEVREMLHHQSIKDYFQSLISTGLLE